MAENESQSDIAVSADTDIIVAPDRSLTVPKERLAGSPACLNCGTGLQGPFCYYCGQPDRNFLRFFPVLLREMLSDFLDLDSRFARTMKPLLFRPGHLTRDYLEGRRYRFTPPVRLYLFSSIIFFLVAALLSSNAAQESLQDASVSINADQDAVTQLEEAREQLQNLPPEAREQAGLNIDEMIASAEEQARAAEAEARESEVERADGPRWFNIGNIQFNDEPWHPEDNPIDLKGTPQWLDDWINRELEDSPAKAEEINRNPSLIIDQIFDILPATMFVLLPVVALLFKFWYLFAKRFYIEHLIFALHNHAFLFVASLLILLSTVAMGWAAENEAVELRSAAKWFLITVSAWIPIYLFWSLRTVYRQNWFLTIFKFGVIGLCYVSLLTFLTVAVAILGFLLL